MNALVAPTPVNNPLTDAFPERRIFVLAKLVPGANGKVDKIPMNIEGVPVNGQDPANWITGADAAIYASLGFGIGIVITEGCGLACVDIDGARDPDTVALAPHAEAILARFPGAYVEVSQSGRGLHVIFACDLVPPHKTRNGELHIELYTRARFIYLGEYLSGDPRVDHTGALMKLIDDHFGAAETVEPGEWTDGPQGGAPIVNDDELITKFRRSRKAIDVFGGGGKVSNEALWTANADVLGKAWPPEPGKANDSWNRSSADMSLASRLAFWTGGDCERMQRLMLLSELGFDRDGKPKDYMRRTIVNACAGVKTYYGTDRQAPVAPALAVANIPPPPAGFPPLPPPEAADAPDVVGTVTALELRISKNGIIPDEENVRRILERDPNLQGVVRFNEFSGEMILTRPITADRSVVAERGIPRPWQDSDTVILQTYIQRFIVPRMGREKIEAVVAMHARHNCAFHPMRDYLQSLSWDGVPRLNTWLRVYLGADSQPEAYLVAIGPAWLISAVARVFEPGCQADNALVLEGAQGIYKSTALRGLAGDAYFSDSLSADLAHKDARDHLRGKWIIELAELAQFKRAEIETVKLFITRRFEQYRPSYGHHEVKFPRQCVFAGTTNDETYLVDKTGNRRWWVVACTHVDLAALARDRDQLWAEAVHRYRAGEKWYLSKADEELAEAEARVRVAHDPWTATVADAVATKLPFGPDVSPGEVMLHMSLQQTERHERSAGRVGQILRDLGWRRGKRHMTRGQLYLRPGYVAPSSVPPVPAAPRGAA